MPIIYLRSLTAEQRSPTANQHLAGYLAFVAGAVNAGGFLAVHQYTSHMSGIVASMSDSLALAEINFFLKGAAALLAFICGASTSAVLINLARRAGLASVFALPLILEALLLLIFGAAGTQIDAERWAFIPPTVLLLCYVMGLQNSIITKASKSEIRTTHVTGMVTDIGIELGKLLYWNRNKHSVESVRGDRKKLYLLSRLVGLFFIGGVIGALSFKNAGFVSVCPLAVLVLSLGVVPIYDDIRKCL